MLKVEPVNCNNYPQGKLRKYIGLTFCILFSEIVKTAVPKKVLFGLHDSLLMDLGQDQLCNQPTANHSLVTCLKSKLQ